MKIHEKSVHQATSCFFKKCLTSITTIEGIISEMFLGQSPSQMSYHRGHCSESAAPIREPCYISDIYEFSKENSALKIKVTFTIALGFIKGKQSFL